jgi:predicted methyltransferase
MKTAHLIVLALLAAPLGCEETPAPVTPPPPPAETAATAPPPAETAKPAEPTPEEKKKAEEEKKKADAARELAADRAQMDTDTQAEAARWTPELHAEAKKLASAKYASLKVALKAVLAGHHRKPTSAARDAYRHPAETLEFFGLKPTMTVLEYGPGEGWYTELLAPTLATKGKLFITNGDPNGPMEARSTFYAERTRRFLGMSSEAYGKVETVTIDSKAPKLPMEGKLDMIVLCRELHGLHRNKLMTGLLAEAFKALKPGGVLGVEQHRAKAEANPDESAKHGYLPEAWVIQQIEAAGFKLAGKSEVNANPKDTKDYPEGVWTLPPSFELKDKDRAKYAAIGESDRMTLKFVKPKK